ncbi:DUF2207 domain-containing protein [Spartinivicinus ruber]|uniref:DUF2207 domain-containing protein n=1 Tax=Spartinivicinus ruber TaxID=2683272 RepID=UPI0015B5F887|nr:DUF2207 domain-containing protein [Spartinivicinus ruber]
MKGEQLRRIGVVRWFALLTFIVLILLPSAQAAEEILSFDSAIQIKQSGDLIVTETITVNAEGNQIRRGIYRDFPTKYKDRYGHNVNVGFEVLGVLRDNENEARHVESMPNGTRVYIGSPDQMLPDGTHTYKLKYRTTFQLGFFEAFDELYFNVTGNGWVFPILKASATVTLPTQVAREHLQTASYTGPQGSTANNAKVEITSPHQVRFETTRPLDAYQGLTIAVGFPKGIVDEPTAADRALRFFSDNLWVLLGLVLPAGLFMFYFRAWQRVGKDPEKGIIIPRYEAPGGYSPASLRYILRMGYDTTCLAAALVNLAVKGYIRIEQKGGFLFSKTFTVHRTESDAKLAPGESIILRRLLGQRKSFSFDKQDHKIIQSVLSAHKRWLEKDFNKKYFILNSNYLVLGWGSSVVVVILMALLGAFPSFAAFVIVGLLLIINTVFSIIMKAPTLRGRKIMDEIEGLKLYLGVAERQDLERQKEPPQTFEEFEKFLPYAVALGCASTWADHFKGVLAAMEQSDELPQRGWYTSTNHVSAANMVSSINALGSSLSSNISSSSTPPGSSSGSGSGSSGGGFSGGGGGGGGGGGW